AERSAEVAGGADRVGVDGHAFDAVDRAIQWHGQDLGRIEGDHRTELAILDAADGGRAEAERDQAIVSGGRAAALEVAQHERARLATGPLGDLRRHPLGDTAVPGLRTGLPRRDERL